MPYRVAHVDGIVLRMVNPRGGNQPTKEIGTGINMRPRRFVGILERALLGAAMSVVLSIVERRLSRQKDQRDARHTPDHQPRDGESNRVTGFDGVNGR